MKLRTLFWIVPVLLIGLLSGAAKYRHSTPLEEVFGKARSEHKTLMLEFGAGWCSDCQELALDMTKSPLREYVEKNFIVQQIDVGQFDRNLDLAKTLGANLDKGIPAVVFYSPEGRNLGNANGGEILAFLNSRRKQGS